MNTKTCPHCDYTRMPMDGDGNSCPRCKEEYSTPPKPRPKNNKPTVPSNPIDRAWYLNDFGGLSAEQLLQACKRIDICTLESMPGKQIDSALGLVSGTYTVAFGAIFEAVAGLARNIRGTGNSPQTEQYIEHGISQALTKMKLNAMLDLRAEGVVGIRYQFNEFSGANGKGILVVVCTGTAVSYRKAIANTSEEELSG